MIIHSKYPRNGDNLLKRGNGLSLCFAVFFLKPSIPPGHKNAALDKDNFAPSSSGVLRTTSCSFFSLFKHVLAPWLTKGRQLLDSHCTLVRLFQILLQMFRPFSPGDQKCQSEGIQPYHPL